MNMETILQIINNVESLQQFSATDSIKQKLIQLSQQLQQSLLLTTEIQIDVLKEEIEQERERNRIIPKFTEEDFDLYKSVFNQLFNQKAQIMNKDKKSQEDINKKMKVKVLIDSEKDNDYLLKETFWKTLRDKKDVFIIIELPNRGIIGWYIDHFKPNEKDDNMFLEANKNHFFFIFRPNSKDFVKFKRILNEEGHKNDIFLNLQKQPDDFCICHLLFSLSTNKRIYIFDSINKFSEIYSIPKTQVNSKLIDFFKENKQFNRLIAFTLSTNDSEALPIQEFMTRITPQKNNPSQSHIQQPKTKDRIIAVSYE